MLSLDKIAALIDYFITAARCAQHIDFNLIALHATHSYLLHQFLSLLTDQRENRYSSSLQNRMHLTLEFFQALCQALPLTMAVGVHISDTDWIDDGVDMAQFVALG